MVRNNHEEQESPSAGIRGLRTTEWVMVGEEAKGGGRVLSVGYYASVPAVLHGPSSLE